jgi:hypothetical protein
VEIKKKEKKIRVFCHGYCLTNDTQIGGGNVATIYVWCTLQKLRLFLFFLGLLFPQQKYYSRHPWHARNLIIGIQMYISHTFEGRTTLKLGQELKLYLRHCACSCVLYMAMWCVHVLYKIYIILF